MLPEPDPETAKASLSTLLDRRVTALERIGGGRNSRVYRLQCGRRESFAVKYYLRSPTDGRNRLQVEYSSLQFLWKQGFRSQPKPVASAPHLNCGVYEFIEGTRIGAGEATSEDIAAAVDFLGRLKEAAAGPAARRLPAASDASFTIEGILKQIDGRLARFASLSGDELMFDRLSRFLSEEFKPALRTLGRRTRTLASRLGCPLNESLRLRDRSLSPSDFGFHNAIRRTDGRLAFLDFEYFGWDDPAKTISDFLLHPGMSLTRPLKRRFLSEMLSRFSRQPNLEKRLAIVYPLWGLKWCLILLNEFLPHGWALRQFSSRELLDLNRVRVRQLSKSRRLLRQILEGPAPVRID